MPPELEDDHVLAICRVLAEHRVRYIIIGGAAARLHGTGHVTVDIDICPERSEDNLTHLADALNALGTRLRIEGDPEGVEFPAHRDLLRQMTALTLLTRHGPLDLCFVPAGFAQGYEQMVEHSVLITLAGTDLPVAALEDVVTSKRAAGRPKDIVELPALEAHLRRRPAPD